MPSYSTTAPPRRKEKKKPGRKPRKIGPPPKKPVWIPAPIDIFDDSMVGRTVWFFHPREGVSHITVTEVYSVTGRNRKPQWGLWYEVKGRNGGVHRKTLWVRDYPLFESRKKCHDWVYAMLEKSDSEKKADFMLGLWP